MKTTKKLFRKTKSQVWVETAIYTLIGLSIIAILLSIVAPQLEKMKDSEILKQTILAMEELDEAVSRIGETPGNVKVVPFRISKGRIEFNPLNDRISFILENSRLKLSEPGIEIKEGNIIVLTKEKGKRYDIRISLVYDNLNLTYNNKEGNWSISAGAAPAQIYLENKGSPSVNGTIVVDVKVE